MMEFTHKGKALVIGGSSGMGLATAKLLVSNNVDVIIVGRKADKLEQAVSQVLTDGLRTKDIHFDGMTCVGTDEMGDAVIKALSTLLD